MFSRNTCNYFIKPKHLRRTCSSGTGRGGSSGTGRGGSSGTGRGGDWHRRFPKGSILTGNFWGSPYYYDWFPYYDSIPLYENDIYPQCYNFCCNPNNCKIDGTCHWNDNGKEFIGSPFDCTQYRYCVSQGNTSEDCIKQIGIKNI